MLGRVIFDLMGFGTLFGVLIFFTAMITAVIGFQNKVQPGDYKEKWDEEMSKDWREEIMEGSEYIYMPGIEQYIYSAIRLSIGDFEFDGV